MCHWMLAAMVAVLSVAGLAHAADIGVPKAPAVVAPPPTWAGVYIGINVGGGWTRADWSNVASAPPASFFDHVPGDSFGHDVDGVIGGGQIGFNHQIGAWVLGVETLVDGSAMRGSRRSTGRFGAADDEFTARIDMLLLATGRVGYAWGRALGYAKGGYAGVAVHASVNDAVGPFTGSGSDSRWASGWTVGGGFEYALTPSVSLGGEYSYVELDAGRYQLGGGAGRYVWDMRRPSLHLLLAKLNYRFTWPR